MAGAREEALRQNQQIQRYFDDYRLIQLIGLTRDKVGGEEKSVIFHISFLMTHISLTIFNAAPFKNVKPKPNACSLLENYQNLKI